MTTLTLHDVPDDLAQALERERARRGESLDRTAIELLREALAATNRRTNGLERFWGTWSEEQFREFEAAVADFERIDEAASA